MNSHSASQAAKAVFAASNSQQRVISLPSSSAVFAALAAPSDVVSTLAAWAKRSHEGREDYNLIWSRPDGRRSD
jgi:hypothetical protein